MRLILIIGHRGTGKTHLLERMEAYWSAESSELTQEEVRVCDLDAWIEHDQGQSIEEIFSSQGEAHFRNLERKCLRELVAKWQPSCSRLYVALGAGFELNEDFRRLKSELQVLVECLWLRRSTDSSGRVFLDRPALLKGTPPLEEYLEKFGPRQESYRLWADDVLEISEGFDRPNLPESLFLTERLKNVGGVLTLLPESLRSSTQTEKYLSRRLSWGIDFFELRDDLLSFEQIHWVVEFFKKNKRLSNLLCSYRATSGSDSASPSPSSSFSEQTGALFGQVAQGGGAIDWALELGSVPQEICSSVQGGGGGLLVLSLHELKEGEDLKQAALRLEQEGLKLKTKLNSGGGEPCSLCLKFAPPIRSFSELREGHGWLKGESVTSKMSESILRVFLPRSEGGRWAWYRLLMKPELRINFWRESDGSSLDQPNLLDWLRHRVEFSKGFAAILGQPVLHSLTPAEQGEFFAEQGMNVMRIDLSPQEWTEDGAMDFLRQLGLRAAAVTSPLKGLAFQLAESTQIAQELEAVNTLVWKDGRWLGHNTDERGLIALKETLKGEQEDGGAVVVWGGGGTLKVLQRVFPQAQLYSARSGQPRELKSPAGPTSPVGSGGDVGPELVVWAVGRKPLGWQWPDSKWAPKIVVDLNYGADSPGLEYAKQVGAQYISGRVMFLAQAAGQREFWKEILR